MVSSLRYMLILRDDTWKIVLPDINEEDQEEYWPDNIALVLREDQKHGWIEDKTKKEHTVMRQHNPHPT